MSAPRRAVVTGAGPGSIGEAVARALAADGWEVVVTTRAAPAADHAWHPLDLADRGSVARFAQWYADRADRLHLLVNSAGIHLDLGSRWSSPQVVDGHEVQVDGLLGRAPAYDSWAAYGTSKLGLVHHAAWLAEEYEQHGLRAISVHPGAVSTNIAARGLETRPVLRVLRNLARPLERRVLMSPEASAALLVGLATHEATPSSYHHKARVADPSAAAQDRAVRAQLMAETRDWLAAAPG